MIPGICSAPCCKCRIHLEVVQCVSQDMHGMGGVSGAMAEVLVDARRASVAMLDEHQNAQEQLLTSRRGNLAQAHRHVSTLSRLPHDLESV